MTAPKFPPRETLDIAIAWLRANEGDGPERPACLAVAAYLEAIETDRTIKAAAREAGIPVAKVRQRLAAQARS